MSKDKLLINLAAFKRKYYTNQLIRGSLLSALLFGSIFLLVSLLEGYFWFSQPVRFGLFFLLTALLLYCIVFQIIRPLMALFHMKQGLSNEEAAREVGLHFPDINDKLLNYFQLANTHPDDSSLLAAALEQKTQQLAVFTFKEAVDFRVNKKYVYYFIGLIAFILMVSFINPRLFNDSTARILSFNQQFEKPAPFSFVILDELKVFANDSYELKVQLRGKSLPDEVSLKENGRLLQMNRIDLETYIFTFPSVIKNRRFSLISAGFESKMYELEVFERPEIRVFEMKLDYPAYTKITDDIKTGTGGLIVPEGTKITWNFESAHTDRMRFIRASDSIQMNQTDQEHFEFMTIADDTFTYEIESKNSHASNKSKMIYEVQVIKDQMPELEATFIPDTITYNSFLLTGQIQDDYGFKSLSLYYHLSDGAEYRHVQIPFDPAQNVQPFLFQMDIDSLHLNKDETLEVYAVLTDNDAVNGFKSTTSAKFRLRMPDQKEIDKIIDEKSDQSENQLEKSLKKSESLNDKLKELENRLKNKTELNWQDQKLIEDILQDRERLQKDIEELKEKHDELITSQKQFDKQSEKLQQKSKELNQLINQIMDEDTKKLYDELQKLLEQQRNNPEAMEQMSKLQNKETNVEKELERALELFKRLKLETELEQTADALQELGKEQKELAKETEKTNQDKDQDASSKNADLQEQQQSIQEQFEEIQEKMDAIEELNKDLKRPEPMEDFTSDEKNIDQKLQDIQQQLQKSDLKTAPQKMQNAGEQMEKMAGKMQKMQGSMEMIMMQENIDQLRDILDNLIKLSFSQENIINQIKEVQQVDPRFIELSQDQLKLMDNSKVIEDSLLALAGRVAQISNFVTREVAEINTNLNKAMAELKERNKSMAGSYQQFAMTSMNNLALLLQDVLENMQMSMAEAMGNPQSGKGDKQSMPQLSKMQSELGQQMEELKASGKTGRELSEELAKMAAQQAAIRSQLESMQKQLQGEKESGDEDKNGKAAGKLGEAIKQMEENETDLVNKRLTQQLINRQKQIMTRMLEAEESMRQQKTSPEREGETATEQPRKLPPAVEEYLNARKQEIEFLKTIPLDLNPFYKKEVNDYFRRLSGADK